MSDPVIMKRCFYSTHIPRNVIATFAKNITSYVGALGPRFESPSDLSDPHSKIKAGSFSDGTAVDFGF